MRDPLPTDRVNDTIRCPCCRTLLLVSVGITARDPNPIDWSRVDWSQDNKSIARKIGRSAALVSRTRQKLFPTSAPRRAYNWSDVDWSQSHSTLVMLTGFSSSKINQMRHKYAPQTVGKTGLRGKNK